MAKKPLFLALVAIATVAVVVPMTVFGLPYSRFEPESFTHLYTRPENQNQTHLHIDADATNGSRPCDPIDSEARVKVGATHEVAVCIETYVPNSVNNFELHIRYTGDPNATPPTTINTAQTLACGAGTSDTACLDANPDANDGDDPTGFKLGSGWDCTGFGIFLPMGEDPSTPGVADARIVCNASLGSPDQDLAADPGLLATIEFTATGTGDDVIDFGPADASNKNIVYRPRPGNGVARCGTKVAADQVSCFGAVIHKVVFDCMFEDDFGRGTSLGLLGNDWEFGFPGGTIGGTGRVMHFGNRVMVIGRATRFNVIGSGTCPSGPGSALAFDFSRFPFRILKLRDVTALD